MVQQNRLLTRRSFLCGAVCGAAGLGLTGAYSKWIEPGWVTVERVRVAVPRLPSAFDGFTIAQLSDLHFGRQVPTAHIQEAVEVTRGLAPDAVVITGDFVSNLRHGEAQLVVNELSRLNAPAGIWAVLGNHDHWTNPRIVAEAVKKAGMRLLRNNNSTICRGEDCLWMAGVDDVTVGCHDLPRTLSGIPPNAATVLLVHEPDFADEAALERRIGLQLSGHSHGGQVRIPFFGAIHLPPLGRKYPEGLRRVSGMWVYTNRGIGTTSVPYRFNCRPEVTLLTLVASKQRAS